MKWTAPCGCPGEPIIGAFVLCRKCDGVKPRCKKCGTDRVKPFILPGLPPDAMACEPHGHVYWSGIETD